ncbi:MAG: DUF2339 domain-containing protein [Hyphomonadaceae bacterium]
MEWILILGLAGWVWWQSQRIGKLERRLNELERPAAAVRAPAPAQAAPPTPAPGWFTPTKPAPSEPPPAPPANEDADDVLALDQPLPPDDREPLLLDTPLPPVSNDENGAAAAPAPDTRPPLELTADAIVPPEAKPEPAPETPRRDSRRLENWLAQNGLAWLAGAVLVLTVIALVQQSWFTPPLQLASAVVFGLALIGASEWARRVSIKSPPGHPLVAALLAAGGAVTFYAVAWVAHGVYQFIGWDAAALLLLASAFILFGLSLLHGQALGVLAVLAALLTPPLASADAWPSAALSLYVCGVGAAGFALAWFRRWAWVAVVTIAGLYFWFGAAILAEEVRRALALISFASIGGVIVALRKPLPDELGALTWTRIQQALPSIAICVSSVVLMAAWVSLASSGMIAGPAWIGAFHVALAALAVRARAAHPAALAVAIGFLVLGFMAFLQARFYFGPPGNSLYPSLLFASLVVAVSALGARPHRHGRGLVAASGAIGSGLLTLLAATTREHWHSITAWLPLFSGASILFACAWRAARDVADPKADRGVDFWAGAGCVLVLIGVESAFPAEIRTAAHAGAALLIAAGFNWRGWRALRFATLTAAALAVGHALSPSLIGATLGNEIPLWGALLVLTITAGLLYAAAHFMLRAEARNSAEALGSAAIIILLTGGFLALRWFAVGGAGASLDALAETGLRATALMAAGYVLLSRPGDGDAGLIAKWRGHVLIALGLLLTLSLPGLFTNPWWGGPTRAIIAGPPIFNAMLIAIAAPAALALAAAARLYDFQRWPARIYACAGGAFALLWIVLELRRGFVGDDMAFAPVGLLEASSYALVFLGAALAVAIVARVRAAKNPARPFTHDLTLATRAAAWAGLASSALIMLGGRHPVWGVHNADATGALATGLSTLAHAIATILALILGRALSRANQPLSTRFAAAAAAVLFAWSFGHAAIRWLHHGAGMDGLPPLTGLEGFAHALWPLALVLAGAEATARAPGRDTVRAYLFDLQAIWSAAVWPALAFAGLGLWALFNPWWGVAPASVTGVLGAVLALAGLLAAAGMSALAPRVPHIWHADWFRQIARVACVAHLFVAITLIVRWAFHGAAMDGPPAQGAELWAESAAWAAFGAGVLTLGGARNDPALRWCGLVILFATAGKVMLFDTAEMSPPLRFGSLVVLSAILFAATWLARRQAARRGEDLVTVAPTGRRGTRRDRRQSSP